MTGRISAKKGFLYVVISYKDEGGSYKTKWISTGLTERGNKKAAKEILERELKNFEQELALSKDKIERRSKPKEVDKSIATMPFSQYCLQYLESIKDNISNIVYQTYKHQCESRIREYFDKHKLRLIDVGAEEIKDFYDYLKGEGLKNITLRHYACVLRPALRQAYKDKLIPDNPYDFVPSLKREKTPMDFYDKNEMAKFFEVIEGHPLELAYKMAAYYGFRRSELLGLRWQAIDFEHKTVSINHKVLVIGKDVELSDTLKTKTSRRTLPLLPVIEELLLQKKREIEENKQFYGKAYNQQYLDYVFVDESGKIIFPDRLTQNFSKILKNNNLKHIRLHDLRHSCASIMLANGVQMKQIQEWLGHSNFSTTADVYSHLDFSSKVQSAETIANALGTTAPKPQTATSENRDENDSRKQYLIKALLEEMSELGIESLKDYLAFIDGEQKESKAKKSDICM